jgi:hypothetical protein
MNWFQRNENRWWMTLGAVVLVMLLYAGMNFLADRARSERSRNAPTIYEPRNCAFVEAGEKSGEVCDWEPLDP